MRQFFPCAPNIAYSFKAEPSLHRSIAAHQENPTPKPTSINRLPGRTLPSAAARCSAIGMLEETVFPQSSIA